MSSGTIFINGTRHRETVWNSSTYWHWELHQDTRPLLHKGKKPRK